MGPRVYLQGMGSWLCQFSYFLTQGSGRALKYAVIPKNSTWALSFDDIVPGELGWTLLMPSITKLCGGRRPREFQLLISVAMPAKIVSWTRILSHSSKWNLAERTVKRVGNWAKLEGSTGVSQRQELEEANHSSRRKEVGIVGLWDAEQWSSRCWPGPLRQFKPWKRVDRPQKEESKRKPNPNCW